MGGRAGWVGMRRRQAGLLLLGGLPALLAAPRVSRAAAPAPIAFRVLREGSPVGTHRVTFAEAEGLLRARSELVVEVRLLGIPAYRYCHDIEEAWHGGRLIALSSRLDRNGRRFAVEARADEGALVVTNAHGMQRLPPETAPLTWWRDRSFPDAPLLDVREGRFVQPRLERLMPPPGGGARWRLVGGEGAEIGYDPAGRWVEFATTGEDGSAIRYEQA
jgi:hypothetical protein